MCIRDRVKAAVQACHHAGIRPVMITGDHKATAVAIAQELGFWQNGDLALTGADLDFLPEELLEEQISRCSVFAASLRNINCASSRPSSVPDKWSP